MQFIEERDHPGASWYVSMGNSDLLHLAELINPGYDRYVLLDVGFTSRSGCQRAQQLDIRFLA
jgi:hypothetical protein